MSSSFPRRAAGIDVGSEQLFVAVACGPVRVFSTFTAALIQIKDYLIEQQVTTVAMESTGVYWVPVFEVLEEAGLEVYVVNAAHARNLPARKTDMKDCQWLAELHSKQMLNSGFIPPAAIRELRDYTRLRQDHIQMAMPHILHMQKALDQMNLKIHEVLSDLTGASGRRLVEAILSGERRPEALVQLCDVLVLKNKRTQMLAALQGRWKESQVFALRQAYENWCHYQKQIAACDQQIGQVLEKLAAQHRPTTPEAGEDAAPRKRLHKNAPAIKNLGPLLRSLSGGHDLTQLPCLTHYSVMQLLAEVAPIWPDGKTPSTLPLGLVWPRAQGRAARPRKVSPAFVAKPGNCFVSWRKAWRRASILRWAVFIAAYEAATGARWPILLLHANSPCSSITRSDTAGTMSNKA